jgi:hypothetical protein
MARAGIDTADPLVQSEAQAVALAAQRALRTGRHITPAGMTTGLSRTSLSGRRNTPFSSFSTSSSRGALARSALPRTAFALVWLALLVPGILFLWRTMRPRSATG